MWCCWQVPGLTHWIPDRGPGTEGGPCRQVWFRLRAEVLSWGAAAAVLATVVGAGARGLGAEWGAVGGVGALYLAWLAWAQADAADAHHALRAALRSAARVLQVGWGREGRGLGACYRRVARGGTKGSLAA